MKNWLTTLFGGVTAIGLFLSHNASPVLQTIGNIAASIGAILLGGSAKDSGN